MKKLQFIIQGFVMQQFTKPLTLCNLSSGPVQHINGFRKSPFCRGLQQGNHVEKDCKNSNKLSSREANRPLTYTLSDVANAEPVTPSHLLHDDETDV